jgi:hypothetical protein
MAASRLNNLGNKVVSRPISWADMVRRSWGAEFNAPDRGIYEFSSGRRFDSTDRETTGIYFTDNDLGIMIDNARYPDMASYVLVEDDTQLDQN